MARRSLLSVIYKKGKANESGRGSFGKENDGLAMQKVKRCVFVFARFCYMAVDTALANDQSS